MKKSIFYFILSSFIITCLSSCELFKLDNYDAPDQTIWGYIIDKNHPNGPRPLLTNQGSEGIRIRLRELSWSATPDNFDFWCMKDGKYQNTKVFAGYYQIQADGPFIPLIRNKPDGTNIEDKSVLTDIKGGITQVDFEVEPFLRIEWDGEPKVTGDGVITCKFKVTRGVTEARLSEMLQPTGTWASNSGELFTLFLFCGESKDVGYRDGQRYWRTIEFPIGTTPPPDYLSWPAKAQFTDVLGFGQTVTMTTSGKIPTGHTVFVRCGARIRYQTQGVARPLYNEAKRVDIRY